ncbi:MAG: cation:H+ antiporter, partial [Mycobacterium sp.]|nr:cation:H+ antiporter [Mycobacterium sp.]
LLRDTLSDLSDRATAVDVLHKGQLSRPETEARARPEDFRPGAPATCAQHRDVVEGTHTRIDSRELVTAAVGAASLDPPTRERDDDGGAILADRAHTARLVKDQRWFMAVFVVKVALGLVAFAIKPWLGLLFFAAYGVYFWREIRGGTSGDHDEHELAPLKLQPRTVRPATTAVMVQTMGALAVIFVSSQIFVHQLDAIGPMLGLSSAVTALLLSPIATELPETMNAIIWVRQGKTQLALANISGAMMIQATVPSGLGLLFTDWRLDHALLWSGAITMAAITYLLVTMRANKLTPTETSGRPCFRWRGRRHRNGADLAQTGPNW